MIVAMKAPTYAASANGLVRLRDRDVDLLDLPHADLAAALQDVGLAGLEGAQTKAVQDADALELIAPFQSARTVFIVGLNYAANANDRTERRQKDPVIVATPGSALSDGSAVALSPAAGSLVLPEGEIGVVVGARAHNVTAAQGWDCIAGLTLINDFTAVDLMKRAFADPLFDVALGKSFPGFKAAGPYLAPRTLFEEKFDITVRTTVNGQLVQHGTTAHYVFSAGEVIAYASRFFALEPGDLVCMGAPVPATTLATSQGLVATDIVEVSADGFGVLRTTIAQ